MEKVFEDYFSELQADMVSVCMEYVEKRAEKIYIYCACESKVIVGDFFCKINGKIVKKSKLNDALTDEQTKFDVSLDRQKKATIIINDDIKALYKLCQENQREMPTEIKLIYDVEMNKLNAKCSYDLMFSNDPKKTAYDILDEWYEIEKNKEK